jgi:prepilin-type N-terminal cleavage/methylation domain-containing protein
VLKRFNNRGLGLLELMLALALISFVALSISKAGYEGALKLRLITQRLREHLGQQLSTHGSKPPCIHDGATVICGGTSDSRRAFYVGS